jgi:hypothetical protein
MFAKAGIVCELRGDPGVGKSSLIRQFADKFNLFYIDKRITQLEPPQLNGLEYLDHETKKTVTYLPDWIPLEGDPIPEGYDGWLINFEERPDGDECVKKALYQILLERTAMGNKLHSKVIMTSTGNMLDTNCYAEEDSDAIKTRKADIYIKSDLNAFLDHCYSNNICNQITSYLNFRPKNVNNYREMETGADKYACERVWFAVDKFIAVNNLDLSDQSILPGIAGLMGEPTARDWMSFLSCYQYLPLNKDILADPENTPIPEDPGTRFAVTGNIAQYICEELKKPDVATDLFEQMMIYIKRLPLSFQTVCMIDLTKRDYKLMDLQPATDWFRENGRRVPTV